VLLQWYLFKAGQQPSPGKKGKAKRDPSYAEMGGKQLCQTLMSDKIKVGSNIFSTPIYLINDWCDTGSACLHLLTKPVF
jgi:hypothetical protein